jgi:hypothetical protein
MHILVVVELCRTDRVSPDTQCPERVGLWQQTHLARLSAISLGRSLKEADPGKIAGTVGIGIERLSGWMSPTS